jgi:hypothetical protein
MPTRRSRRRVAATRKEIAAAHDRLDELFARASSALRARHPAASALQAVADLEAALDAHFDQEDRLYYPPIRALRPQRKPVLAALGEAHERFRRDLASIVRQLEGGAPGRAATAFAAFETAFGEHELGEEEMLRSLERELAAG